MAWLRWRYDAGDGQGLKTCCVCQEARQEQTWCLDCQAVELWPENLPAVGLYLDCETQWQLAGMDGRPVGLNYPGVQFVMAARGDPLDLFPDIQRLEREYLSLVAERAAKANPPAAKRM